MPWRRLIITALIIAPLLALFAYGFMRDARYIHSPLIAKAAAPFAITLFDGTTLSLESLRGKAVFLNFWASWCPPCRAEMPSIEKVYQAYQGRGLVVLGVNTTFQDSESDVAAFVEQFGLTFPILLDREGGVSRRYQMRGLPSTFFIDRQGIIRTVVIGGPMSEAVIQSKVEELLRQGG